MVSKILDLISITLCVILIFLAIILPINDRLGLLLLSGLFVGFYYGKNNFELYHSTDPFKYSDKSLKFIAQVDAYWKHIVCGLIGSVSLYLLLNRTSSFTDLNHLAFVDLILFLMGVLGYTGLLPLTLTIFAVSGKLLDKLFGN